MLLFSDPTEFAKKGRENTYPNSWWMPGMAVQSGTVYVANGDPITPFYPAIGKNKFFKNSFNQNSNQMVHAITESAYRIPESSANLPYIPVQPIGYDEAEILLRYLCKKIIVHFS